MGIDFIYGAFQRKRTKKTLEQENLEVAANLQADSMLKKMMIHQMSPNYSKLRPIWNFTFFMQGFCRKNFFCILT